MKISGQSLANDAQISHHNFVYIVSTLKKVRYFGSFAGT